MLAKTDFTELIASLKQIRLSLLLLLLGIQILTEGLLVFQWCRLAELMGLTAPFSLMLFINAKGTVMEAITPGAKMGGEVLRAVLFRERLGYTTNQSTALIAIQKIISVGALVTINLLSLLFFSAANPFLTSEITRYAVLATLLLLLATFFVLLFRGEWLSRVLSRYQWRGKWFIVVKNWVTEFAGYAQAVSEQRQQLLLQFLLSVFIWGLFPTKLMLLVRPFGNSQSFLALVATTLASYLIAMVGIFPGGLGSFEVSMSSMLMALGLAAEQGLTISLSFRFVTFWFVVFVSLAVAALDSFRQYRTALCSLVARSQCKEQRL